MFEQTEMNVTDEMNLTAETNVIDDTTSEPMDISTDESMNEPPVATTCPVCFDPITTDKNVCSTPCGHVFCFGCMVKCLNTSNTCPYCRSEINNKPIYDDNNDEYEIVSITDDDDDDDYDDDDDDDDDEDQPPNTNPTNETPVSNEQESEDECSIEYVESYFKEKGISYIDLLSVMFNRYPKTMSRRMRRQLDKKLYDMMDLLDEEHMNQYEEINLMIENDVAC
jgi:hypothetical protein